MIERTYILLFYLFYSNLKGNVWLPLTSVFGPLLDQVAKLAEAYYSIVNSFVGRQSGDLIQFISHGIRQLTNI